MTQPPEIGPEEQTQPYGVLPPESEPHGAGVPTESAPAQRKSSNTRTILEIVGALVAVVAIFAAGVAGFGMGWFASNHHHRSDGNGMPMRYFDDGQNDRGGNGFGFPGNGNGDGNGDQSAPTMPNWRDFFGQGGPNGGSPFGGNGQGDNGGGQSMPQLPDELKQWLEQFGQSLGGDSSNGFGPDQGEGPQNGPGKPVPSDAPTPAPPS